ncbi:putative armadillo-like helical, stromalin conservative domain, cohesin subunit Scc3/SA [Plasmopara halstedii]
MSARRGTRLRRKPATIYQVEDTRGFASDGVDGEEKQDASIENGRDEESSDDGPECEDEEFTLAGTKAKPRESSRKETPTRALSTVSKSARPKCSPWSHTRRMRSAARANTGKNFADPKKNKLEDNEHTDVKDLLFEAVKSGKSSLETLLTGWRDRFEKDYEMAMKEVLNLVLQVHELFLGYLKMNISDIFANRQACGGKNQCAPESESLDQLNMGLLVDHIVEDLENIKGEYPLISRAKGMKKFQFNFEIFWDAFVRESYESEILFTSNLANDLIDWLTTLSSSEIRPIRHTATFAVLSLSNALVSSASKNSEQLAIVKRQFDAEVKSPISSSGTGNSPNIRKLSHLKDSKTFYENRSKQLLKLINLIFTGVVVRRYRDVMPEIRVVTIQCLGHWIITLPDQFLKDNFLKYLGWLLSDKSALVRLEVVEILCELYENDAFTDRLTLFTARFLPRYLELCNDVDDAVVEQCIHLLIAVDKHSLISSEIELQSVEKLVFDTEHEAIRKAAAEFVCLQYDAFGVAVSKTKNAKLKKEQLNTQAIALVEFAEEYIQNYSVPESAVETLVDAFWGLEDCLVLQEWRLMTDLLLVDKSAPDLSSDQQTILLRLLVASVRKLVGNANANKKELENIREEVTVAYCKDIPSLLLLYQADPDKLALILELIPMLTLKSEVIGHHSSHAKELLEMLKHAYLLHSNDELLTSLSLAITHLLQTEHSSLKREAEVIVHELIQEIVSKTERYLEADKKLFEKVAIVASDTPKTRTKKAKGRKKKSALTRDISDVDYNLRISLCRIKCLVKYLNIREYLPSVLSESKASGNDHAFEPDLKQGRMENFVIALGELLHRRTKSSLGLDEGFRYVDTIKHILTIIYFDLLWTTAPIFKAIEDDNKKKNDFEELAIDEVDSFIQIQIQKMCQLRSKLEEALLSVLEMHLVKTNEVADEKLKQSEENIDAELVQDDNVISYIKEVQRFAFLTLCDVRCLFVEKFSEATTPYDALEWKLPKALVLLTQMHFESEMDEAEEDEPELENEFEVHDSEAAHSFRDWQQKQQKKAEMLIALGRVALCNPSKKHQAAAVLQYYTSSGKPSVEVVKEFGKHIKIDAPVRYLEIQMTVLRRMFASILMWKQDVDAAQANNGNRDEVPEQEELKEKLRSTERELKELAKRFSQSFGIGKISSSLRTPFLRFLREGVRYALDRQAQFGFLDIMRAYLSHLDSSGMEQLREYFMERLNTLCDIPVESEELDSRWRALFDFQASIIPALENNLASSDLMLSPPLKKKRRSASSEPTPMQKTSIAEEVEDQNAVLKTDIVEKKRAAGDSVEADLVAIGQQLDHNKRQKSILQKREAMTDVLANPLSPRKRVRPTRNAEEPHASEKDDV